MTAPTVELSEAFLARLPEDERNKATLAMTMFVDMLLLGFSTSYSAEMQETIDKGYFDPDAIITFHDLPGSEGLEQRLPMITALFAVADQQDTHWLRFMLKNVIATHPNMNDEMGNGSFATPLHCAMRNKLFDLTALHLLVDNPHVNPNACSSHNAFTKFVTIKDEFKEVTYGSEARGESHNASLVEGLISQYEKIAHSNRGGHTSLITKFIDAGAFVSSEAIKKANATDGAEYVAHHMNKIVSSLADVRAIDCTLQEFKHAYAFQCLAPLFVEAAENDEAREHLVKLRDEMPKWMQNELGPAYQMLGANWGPRVDERDSSFTGRVK